ncbi:MAG: hypothetical protein LBR49_06685 [Tannerella sp.]|jgi:hypothetical protein|nr:hypothetical protein [Tannerella sp.]
MRYREKNNYKYGSWFMLIAIIIIAICLIYPLVLFLINGTMDWSKSGTFGDSYGALNTLFSGLAFAGVIVTFLIQKHELSFQREEMEETRREFLLNRSTNIIYNQLALFETAVERLTIPIQNEMVNGFWAMAHLAEIGKYTIIPDSSIREQFAVIKPVIMNYAKYGHQIYIFAHGVYSTVKTVESTLIKSSLSLDEINELKDLFFRNIGYLQLGAIEQISKAITLASQISDNKRYMFRELFSTLFDSDLYKANIWLKDIVKFRNTYITQEILEEYRKNWNNLFGKYA